MILLKNSINDNINPVIEVASNTNKDILLVGAKGFGKTTVLNDALNNNERLMINGSVVASEYFFIRETEIFNLYHTCLIIKKILLYVKSKFLDKYIENFAFFEIYIDSIMQQISFMNMTGIYKKNTNLINEGICDKPEMLLDELLGMMSKNLDIQDFILIIDDFDKVGYSSQRYQEFIYERIKNYLQVILSISDDKVVNDQVVLESFSATNEIIKLDYSCDIEMVKEILDKEVHNILSKRKYYDFRYRLRFVLSDETILLMIEKTKGNLFDMLQAIRKLYNHIDELDINDWNSYIIDYIDREINKSPVISGIIVPKRTLFIKPKTTI